MQPICCPSLRTEKQRYERVKRTPEKEPEFKNCGKTASPPNKPMQLTPLRVRKIGAFLKQ
jgi:hypothetical protein